jgi:hypothetical protein
MNLSDIVAPDELLCRYLLSRSQFSPQKKKVKSSAFLPPPDLRLSIFRVVGLTEDTIWEISEKEVVQKQSTPKTLYGRAEVMATTVRETGLTIDPDNDPPRHANILGWPEEKSEQKLIALELSESAKLKLRS